MFEGSKEMKSTGSLYTKWIFNRNKSIRFNLFEYNYICRRDVV